ncbi:MAG TPA: alpha-ketoglutarate-dependent dioxygenase AlkB [Jatrophihabitans sp.]|jgi:alkylated DNA repair dioxygenase AlkB|uniref:alpha-ketoglutarate-dependent dioxygenase AlkB n=1 Tax=Jatrophihabitans sp. TaxID=1932789 RepID=UPI002F1535ED
MSAALQASLLDFADDISLGPLGDAVTRRPLGSGAWLDVRPGWLAGADALFGCLLDSVPWRAEEREMYQRIVAVPRLLSFYDEGAPLPHPVLEEARDRLSAHYADELGEPFRTAGLCLYRDGRDSVAWHGDRIGRSRTEDTMVAILSVGAPRQLLLRPRPGSAPARSASTGSVGGTSDSGVLRHNLGHGDLIVMGGSCQRTWEHAVPKTSKPVGPRISIQFRPRGVR